MQAKPPEGDGQHELRAGHGEMAAEVKESAADDDLECHEAENARQPFHPVRHGLPAADGHTEDFRVPGLQHLGDSSAAEHRQDEAEHRQAGRCCPAMGEQHGDVVGRSGAEAAPDDDDTGQVSAERHGQDHQERDEAEGEHGGELQRVADESELTELLPDLTRHAGRQAVARSGCAHAW